MKIKIKRFNKGLPLPERKTAGAAAFDLATRTAVTIPPRGIGYVPLNTAFEIPPGHFLLLAARSGTHKKGLMMANGMGILDPDFCGDDDEVQAAYYNFTDAPVSIEEGERIAQAMVIQFAAVEWDEVEKLGNKSRGGFGSTGSK